MINRTTLRKIASSHVEIVVRGLVRMRIALLHIVTLIIASASIVGLAYGADPVQVVRTGDATEKR